MSILCTVTSLFQFLILVAITGILVSIAAVSRLMVVLISFVHPISIFMLRQSLKVIIFLVHHSARLASHAWKRTCRMGHADSLQPWMDINVRAPDIVYTRSTMPGLVVEANPLVSDLCTEGSEEPSSQVDENNGESNAAETTEAAEAVEVTEGS